MYLYYKDGKILIPELPITLKRNSSGSGYGINVSDIPLVQEKATRFVMSTKTSDYTSKIISQYEIGEGPPNQEGTYIIYYTLDTNYKFELYNGNTLYFSTFSTTSRSPGDLNWTFAFTVYNASTGYMLPCGNEGFSSNYRNISNFYPDVYLFVADDGSIVMSRIVKYYSSEGQFPNYAIEPGSRMYNLIFKDNEEPTPPFEDDTNTTKPSGGDGEYKFVSEAVPVSPLPTKSAVDAGFVTLYNPTNDQIKNLAQYLWTSDFTTAVKKLFNDPMDAILNLSFVPVKPAITGSKDVSVGFVPTGVTMNTVGEQYVQFDCGSIDVKEQWGSCLDYSPFTKISIYLPYIGEKALDIDDVMNNTIHVYYNIDLLSGSCVAQLYFTNATQPGRVLYTFAGMCATAIPVHGRDFSQLVTAGINLVTAGATAAITGGTAASAVSSLLINSASNISSAKPAIQKSSAIAASSGLLDIQKPYLIFSYPKQSLPVNYKTYQGYPSNITATLSTLTGYTVVEQIHIEGTTATQTEKEQIESLLKEGVII